MDIAIDSEWLYEQCDSNTTIEIENIRYCLGCVQYHNQYSITIGIHISRIIDEQISSSIQCVDKNKEDRNDIEQDLLEIVLNEEYQ